ncbi:MAG: hypothetical protein RLZZ308_22 [Candidatus Parcubacteria bacterium]|jgi:hypothetical protein
MKEKVHFGNLVLVGGEVVQVATTALVAFQETPAQYRVTETARERARWMQEHILRDQNKISSSHHSN